MGNLKLELTQEQLIVFAVLAIALGLFVWGRWRYDLVALLCLVALVLTGIVEGREAFAGMGHPAVITVAAVLVISQALRNAGVVEVLTRSLAPLGDKPWLHRSALLVLVALASAFMNNVGALALLMPVALESALKNGRSPALVLMPLSFAAILGGMMTMIGTPPNVIIAAIRDDVSGEPFTLFQFAPVGAAVACVGVLFVSLVGWRLIPKERRGQASPDKLFKIEEYITEVRIPAKSDWIGRKVGDLEAIGDGDVVVAGLIRDGRRRLVLSLSTPFEAEDVIILRADPTELRTVVDKAKLELVGDFKAESETLRSDEVDLIEAVVPPGSRLEGRTLRSLRLQSESRTNLLAIARQGTSVRRRLQDVVFRGGDVLLLQGAASTLAEDAASVGLLPLAKRNLRIGKKGRPLVAIGVFGAALLIAAIGALPAPVALTVAVLVFVLLDYVSVRSLYDSVDWSVIVLLGAMLPVGSALESTGGTELLANSLLALTGSLPVWLQLALVLVLTMTLSDVINNAATAVVMAPLGVTLANQLGVNSDPFLMAVAVGASCAFLTPIGHQCNTLVLGPGGYRFGDYWRIGLPLEILIVLVSVPLILVFWPLAS